MKGIVARYGKIISGFKERGKNFGILDWEQTKEDKGTQALNIFQNPSFLLLDKTEK